MNNLVEMELPIQIMYYAAMDGNIFGLEQTLESVDLDDTADWLIHSADAMTVQHVDLLNKLIQVARYIEFETDLASAMSDDRYDQLVELYQDLSGKAVPKPDWSAETTGVAEHSYPELRGTLGKVHFVLDKDIPEHDSRKSLESWLSKIKSDTVSPLQYTLVTDAKFDGHSVVFEMSKGTIVKALTRYRTDLNLGKDITHIFQGWDASSLHVPPEFMNLESYGVKTEVYMKYTDLKRYQDDMANPAFNHRSAVASILSRNKGNETLLEYLSVVPFQIATPVEIGVGEDNVNLWLPSGVLNGRHQYIRAVGFTTEADSNSPIADVAKQVSSWFDQVRAYRETHDTPVDGAVVTITTRELIDRLGRKNDVNQFQIAYKFPTGVAKTELKRVSFPVGPCAGTITPLAEVEPVIIDGKMIESVSLSNMDKLERLDLRIGDEVIIQYDIIPKLYKDNTCKVGKGPKIVIPNACPSCGGALSERYYRCENPDCPAKVPGKIYNYVTKMRIPNIGKQTIGRLVVAGIWDGIHSLYRIALQRNDILKVPGFGEKLVNNMIAGVGSRMEAYPHEIFGAIGIPDLAFKTMKKIFQSIDFIDLTRPSKTVDEQMQMLTSIKGIGERKASKLLDGLNANKDLVTFLESHITILPYEDTPEETVFQQNVVFTQVRDHGLEEYLKTQGIGTANTVSAKTITVVTSDALLQCIRENPTDGPKKTTKIKAAEKLGIPIYGIDEYKEKIGYK